MPRPVYELKAELFKTLGHPARIQILQVLRDGEAHVTDIAAHVGVSGSTLSQHLAHLKRADVISGRRQGSLVIYRVTDPRVFQLLEAARQMLTTTLSGSAEQLADLREMDFSARSATRTGENA